MFGIHMVYGSCPATWCRNKLTSDPGTSEKMKSNYIVIVSYCFIVIDLIWRTDWDHQVETIFSLLAKYQAIKVRFL